MIINGVASEYDFPKYQSKFEFDETDYDRGCQQGREDGEKEVLNYLVDNGYIRYGFDTEYLAEQLKGAEQ